MSAGNFKVSYSANAQMALLENVDKVALTRLFSNDGLKKSHATKVMDDGRFVSKVGSKRILWRQAEREKPEIISIVDQSYANGG